MSRRTGAPRLHRTWPQRGLITFNVMCIVVALVAAGSLGYAKRKVGEIDRVVIGTNDFQGSANLGDKPRNFLIVGADTGDGLSAGDPALAGRDKVGGVRSDTIMVVRIDPKSNQAKILSFPRDLWVDIPGESRNRINSSLQFGGPDKLIATIKANFDIDINHYVQVNFAGFKGLVKLLGGVPVYFATPVRDTNSGLNVQTSGCTTLNPDGALSYVRSRHLRYQNANGRWVGDPTSDLGRISRQQDFIKRVLRGAIKKGARNPRTLAGLVNVGVQSISLDQGTTAGDLISLGQAFKNFNPDSLQTYSLPVSDTVHGGAAVLDLKTGQAEPILEMFRGTGATPAKDGILPASVAVQVLNGSGTQNQASDASALLASVGFKMTPPSSTASVPRTEVRYTPGMEAQAALVARHLFANAKLVPDIDVSEVTVITGPDFHAALLQPRPEKDYPVPTTTTTAPASTTTVPGSPSTSGTSSTSAPGPAVTTTTAPTGFVPDAPPAGVNCG